MSGTKWLMAGLLAFAPFTAASAQAPVVRDSAGVRVVANSAPRSAALYRIDPKPLLDLGGGDDELIAPVLAARFPDGRVVVETDGSELRWFDPAGRKIRSFGRKGGGPGEFERITFVGILPGDTVVAFDAGARRLTLVGPAGRLARTVSLANPARRSVAGLLPRGGFLAGSPGSSGADMQSGVMRDTTRWLAIGPGGDSLSAVGRFAGTERNIQVTRANGQISSMNISGVPFGRVGYVGVDDSVVVVASADRYEIRRYSRSGKLLLVASRPFKTESPTAADVDRIISSGIATLPPGQEGAADRIRQSIRDTPLPKIKPPYDGMVVRSNGEIWVRDFIGQGRPDRTGRWTVFDRSGVWITTVDTPAGVEPLAIALDVLLGIWNDADGVPHVRVFRITR